MGCAEFLPQNLWAALGGGEQHLWQQCQKGPQNVSSAAAPSPLQPWEGGGGPVAGPGARCGAAALAGPFPGPGKLFFIYCSLGKLCYC